MTRLVVFRFHRNLGVCRNRLRLLRLFNPGVQICGLYGGPRDASAVERHLSPWLDHVHPLPTGTGDWSWRHGDLALLSWFRERGRSLDFDSLVVVEWDLLLLDSLDNLYRGVPPGSVGLSRLRTVSSAERTWRWVAEEPHRGEWERLLAHVRGRHGYAGEPLACIAGGASLPRAFLEKLLALDIPELGNDEARLPLYAQILGFPLVDTGFYAADPAERRFFSLGGADIPASLILGEVARLGGRRVFHPFRKHLRGLVGGGAWYNFRYEAWKAFRRGLRGLAGPPRGGRS
jgi:hypothetical protein